MLTESMITLINFPWHELDQGSANHGHWAKCGPLPIFVNKVLLEQAIPFIYCLWVVF